MHCEEAARLNRCTSVGSLKLSFDHSQNSSYLSSYARVLTADPKGANAYCEPRPSKMRRPCATRRRGTDSGLVAEYDVPDTEKPQALCSLQLP